MKLFEKFFGGTASPAEPGGEPDGLGAVIAVLLPRGCAEATQSHLRSAGRQGNEGLVVWSGNQDGETFHVRTVVVPRQRGIRTADGVCVVVDGDALHEMNVGFYKRGERLFAQVHSHPGRAYHSPMDDKYAVVTAPGGLSLVVPDFAVRPFDVSECATYRLTTGGRWSEVPTEPATRLIRIVDAAPS